LSASLATGTARSANDCGCGCGCEIYTAINISAGTTGTTLSASLAAVSARSADGYIDIKIAYIDISAGATGTTLSASLTAVTTKRVTATGTSVHSTTSALPRVTGPCRSSPASLYPAPAKAHHLRLHHGLCQYTAQANGGRFCGHHLRQAGGGDHKVIRTPTTHEKKNKKNSKIP